MPIPTTKTINVEEAAICVTLTLERTTKGTIVYTHANGAGSPISTLYVNKHSMPAPYPEMIRVTIDHV